MNDVINSGAAHGGNVVLSTGSTNATTVTTIFSTPLTPENTKYTIRVYVDTGVCYEYEVTGAHKAREHAAAIIKNGYRHNDGKGEFEHWAPQHIDKVKVTGGTIPTLYPDRVSGT